jgi:hypothetical protein
MNYPENRLEEILGSLEFLLKSIPADDVHEIKRSVDSILEEQKVIKKDLEYLKSRLFNPDDGIIVKVNKNTEAIQEFKTYIEIIDDLKGRIEDLEKWKSVVNKTSWFIFTTIGGLLAAFISSVLGGFKLK